MLNLFQHLVVKTLTADPETSSGWHDDGVFRETPLRITNYEWSLPPNV